MSDMTDEERAEARRDEALEYINEQRDEWFNQWKKDNLDTLRRDFCDDNDDFNQFCRDEFKRDND